MAKTRITNGNRVRHVKLSPAEQDQLLWMIGAGKKKRRPNPSRRWKKREGKGVREA